MRDFIECLECEFVLLSASSADAAPKNRDTCPRCGGTDFRFTDE